MCSRFITVWLYGKLSQIAFKLLLCTRSIANSTFSKERCRMALAAFKNKDGEFLIINLFISLLRFVFIL